ncbi:MAG: bifunctional DNA primase/polymerase [Streptosporangiaceae bacterium]|jgi:hypothetical protein
MTGNANRDAARRYGEFGWPVFPLVPGEKVPIYGSDGLKDATTDAKQIEKWWAKNPERNVAIATGPASFDALDIDHGKAGKPSGYKALNNLKQAGLIPQHMASVKTPSRGLHLLYRGTGQTNGRLPAHSVDYRAKGGYVVAVPSTVAGKPYEVVDRHAVSEAGQLDWGKVVRHLEPQRQAQAQHSGRAVAGRDADPDRLAGWLAKREPGERNGSLFWAASRLVEAGKLDTAAREKLLEASRANGLRGGEREAQRTIDSALNGSGQRPLSPRGPERPAEPAAASTEPPAADQALEPEPEAG